MTNILITVYYIHYKLYYFYDVNICNIHYNNINDKITIYNNYYIKSS